MPTIQSMVSAEEWQTRVDLAAAYRLIASHGWDDLIFTHLSARVPGGDEHFLINPFGWAFEEVTASSLVKVDLDGNKVLRSADEINPAGFTIHSAVHAARPDAGCVIHLHTDHGVAVSAMDEGLLPLSQHAMMVLGEVAYHEYEGIAFDLSERDRLTQDLGAKHCMILRNHGTLAVGVDVSAAWLAIYFLERACTMQVYAMNSGTSPRRPQQGVPEHVAEQSASLFDGSAGQVTWPALLRRLQRAGSDYAA